MGLSEVRTRLEHPTFATVVGSFVGYALVLLLIAAALFVLPWLLLTAM